MTRNDIDIRAFDRATLLGQAVAGATGALLAGTLAGCGQASTGARTSEATTQAAAAGRNRKVLIAYFSRAGENYCYGGRRDLKIGNTEVLATMLRKHVHADVYRIQAANPYPHDYEATVARNVREQDADARPKIANPLKSIDDYDVILLGSPIWNVRPPMIMSTFAESFDFSGKTIHPFVTYAVSELGTTMETYRSLLKGAKITAGHRRPPSRAHRRPRQPPLHPRARLRISRARSRPLAKPRRARLGRPRHRRRRLHPPIPRVQPPRRRGRGRRPRRRLRRHQRRAPPRT